MYIHAKPMNIDEMSQYYSIQETPCKYLKRVRKLFWCRLLIFPAIQKGSCSMQVNKFNLDHTQDIFITVPRVMMVVMVIQDNVDLQDQW